MSAEALSALAAADADAALALGARPGAVALRLSAAEEGGGASEASAANDGGGGGLLTAEAEVVLTPPVGYPPHPHALADSDPPLPPPGGPWGVRCRSVSVRLVGGSGGGRSSEQLVPAPPEAAARVERAASEEAALASRPDQARFARLPLASFTPLA